MPSLRALIALLPLLGATNAFPNLPFTVDGPLILDTEGQSVKTAGTNWPGHNDVMIPEGLQYSSISTIVSDIKSLGMNVVRLTFAIEMIDQIFANDGQDVDLQTAFEDALGAENATIVLEDVVRFNPQFSGQSTRLEVFDAVVEELNAQEIYVNLDNHMSSGGWCCSGNDGNTWWGDTYFDADNWVRGLSYMAEHVGSLVPLTCMNTDQIGRVLAEPHVHVPPQRTSPAIKQLGSTQDIQLGDMVHLHAPRRRRRQRRQPRPLGHPLGFELRHDHAARRSRSTS